MGAILEDGPRSKSPPCASTSLRKGLDIPDSARHQAKPLLDEATGRVIDANLTRAKIQLKR